jgi:HK97 family phage major capsid protein
MSENSRTVGAGGVARLASSSVGPRILFEKPESSMKSAEDLANDVKSALDGVRAVAEQALGEAKTSGALTKSTTEKADEALVKIGGLNAELATLQQRLVARGDGVGEAVKTFGDKFVESDSYKALLSNGGRGRASIEQKAILTSLTTNAAGSVGDAINETRLPGILQMPNRRLTVRDLITPGRMDGNSLEYVKETGYTNSAAGVAEGAAKQQSDIKLDLITTSARVIAHYMKASRQVMDDVSQLRSLIDMRLMYGLKLVEEGELLNGDRTGQHLLGIIPQATAFSAPITITTPTSIDNIRLAILQAYLAEFPATGIVMHPSDWTYIELLKDDIGRYIIGNPQGTVPPRLWGLPVVETQAMAVDKYLVGAFMMGAQVFDRWAARIELATENEDDFIKNLVTILCEERLALAVYRPEAFIYGDFGRV